MTHGKRLFPHRPGGCRSHARSRAVHGGRSHAVLKCMQEDTVWYGTMLYLGESLVKRDELKREEEEKGRQKTRRTEGAKTKEKRQERRQERPFKRENTVLHLHTNNPIQANPIHYQYLTRPGKKNHLYFTSYEVPYSTAVATTLRANHHHFNSAPRTVCLVSSCPLHLCSSLTS